jgi:hypothetical protein
MVTSSLLPREYVMSRVTIKDETEFVKLMIDRDLKTMGYESHKITYLKIIGDYVNDLSEVIIQANQNAEATIRELVDEEDIPSDYFISKDTPIINPDTPVGESRFEFDNFDINISNISPIHPESIAKDLDILHTLFESLRPSDYAGLSPSEFIASSKCLKGAEAYEYLYDKKYTHFYSHIHVFPNDLCLLLPDKSTGLSIHEEVSWIEPDGIREQGPTYQVLWEMFFTYAEGQGFKNVY